MEQENNKKIKLTLGFIFKISSLLISLFFFLAILIWSAGNSAGRWGSGVWRDYGYLALCFQSIAVVLPIIDCILTIKKRLSGCLNVATLIVSIAVSIGTFCFVLFFLIGLSLS